MKNLENAVERMAWHQLGMELEKKDRDAIVTFLRSLTDIRPATQTVATSAEDNPRLALQ